MIGINRLIEIKESMLNLLQESSDILKKEFPDHYNEAYSFWIPQIATGLDFEGKWLPRSDSSMQKTIDKIKLKNE